MHNSVDLEEDGSETSKLCRRAAVEYNMGILEDVAVMPQNRLLGGIFTSAPAAKQAVALLKVWLTQRGLRWGVDMLDGHDISLLIAFAVQTRRVPAQATALSIFQSVIQLLADSDLLASDTLLSFAVSASGATGTKADRQRALFPVCLFHPLVASATDMIEYNCFWRVSESSYLQLREEAQHTKRLLQVGLETTFHDVFMQKSTFFQRYEVYYHVPVDISKFVTLSVDGIKAAPHSSLASLNTQIFDLGKRALPLGDRLVSMHTLVHREGSNEAEKQTSHWFPQRLVDSPVPTNAKCSVVIGLVLDQNNAMRKVDRSPTAVSDHPAGTVSDFRRFWGDKCELRRFKDGSIVEALVWEDIPAGRKESKSALVRKSISKGEIVVDNILRYVLGRFMAAICGSVGQDLYSVSCALEQLLPGNGDATPVSTSAESQVGALDPRASMDSFSLHQQLVAAIDSLRRILASDLKSLPLLIDSVTCCQPAARYTSFYPPLPHPFLTGDNDRSLLKLLAGRSVSLVVEPVQLHAVFGHSGKWPASKEAAAKTMTAFLIFIAEQLEKQFGIKSIVHPAHLDISHMGFLFRTNFHQHIVAAPPTGSLDTVYPMTFPINTYSHIASIHHQAVRALAAAHPSFSKAVRLMLAWVAGHQLSGHLSQHAVELLCASVYLRADARRPSSPSAGFILALKS